MVRNEFIITNALQQDTFFCRLSLDGFAPFAEAQAQFYSKQLSEKYTIFEMIICIVKLSNEYHVKQINVTET